MLKRQFLRFLLGMTVLLAAGCAASNLHSVSLEDVKLTDDIVFALRLSPQLHDGDSFGAATEGYLLLVREDGTADYVDVGLMDHGQLAWARNGLFFGGLETEYLLTNTGLISQSRGTKEEFETSRFVNGKKDGFISVYNVGFAENGYRNRVVSGSQASFAAWEAPGMFMAIAQCGEQIVGITDDRELDFTTRKYISVPETSEVLIQLYPQPENVESRILGQVNRTDLYEYGPAAEYSPCVNGVMYMLAEKYNAHNQDAELVLRSWDTASGAYKEIPLIFSETAKHDFNAESFSSVRGSLNSDASAYHWVSWKDGKVFSVNLSSGIVTYLFTLDLFQQRGGAVFYVTDKSVFVLNESRHKELLEFAKYDLPTGEKTHYFDLNGLPSIDRLRMSRNVIRDIAINPNWLEKHHGGKQ